MPVRMILAVAFLVALGAPAAAQDSTGTKPPVALMEDDFDRAVWLMDQAVEAIMSSDEAGTRDAIAEATLFMESLNYQRGMANFHLDLSKANFDKGKFQVGADHALQALTISRTYGYRAEMRTALLNLASILNESEIRHLSTADTFAYVGPALSAAEEIGDPNYAFLFLMASVQLVVGDDDMAAAREYAARAHARFPDLAATPRNAKLLNHAISQFHGLGMNAAAQEAGERALQIGTQLDGDPHRVETLFMLGDIAFADGDRATACRYFIEAAQTDVEWDRGYRSDAKFMVDDLGCD